MRISRWLKIIGFLAVIVVVNLLLCFLIEPESGASERMWAGFYAEEEIDTIFVGSSVSQQTFIPYVFDETMGVKSYNMGTPSQAIPQSRRAIEMAMEDHDIKTVIFGMGFSSLKYAPITEAKLTFESARVREKGGIEGVFDGLSYLYSDEVRGTEDSIKFLFPWLYNYENFAKVTMAKNVKDKIEMMKYRQEMGEIDETRGLLKGYRNDDDSVFNYDNRWTSNSHITYGEKMNGRMITEFVLLLQFCRDNNLELIVINTPHPVSDLVSCYNYYAEDEKLVKSYCEEYGADYYDFSLSKPEIFESRPEYFCDYEHLNRPGTEVFCQKLSEFLNRRAAGEDMDSYFYSVDEFFEIHADEVNEWNDWNHF